MKMSPSVSFTVETWEGKNDAPTEGTTTIVSLRNVVQDPVVMIPVVDADALPNTVVWNAICPRQNPFVEVQVLDAGRATDPIPIATLRMSPMTKTATRNRAISASFLLFMFQPSLSLRDIGFLPEG